MRGNNIDDAPIESTSRVIVADGDLRIVIYNNEQPTSECIFKVSREKLANLPSYFKNALELNARLGDDLRDISIWVEDIDACTIWLMYIHHEKDLDEKLAVYGLSIELIDLDFIWQILHVGNILSLPARILQDFFARWMEVNIIASATVSLRCDSELVLPCYIFHDSKSFRLITSRLTHSSVDAPFELCPEGFGHIEPQIRERLQSWYL